MKLSEEIKNYMQITHSFVAYRTLKNFLPQVESLEKICDIYKKGFDKFTDEVHVLKIEIERLKSILDDNGIYW